MKLLISFVLFSMCYGIEDQLQRQMESLKGKSMDACGNDFVAAECEDQCLFGWKEDELGCPICECVADGEESLYEGDIKLTPETKKIITELINNRGTSSYLNGRWMVYKDESGNWVVPFTYGSHDADLMFAVKLARNWFAKHTCIRLVPRTTQQNYLEFILSDGCWSYVGKIGGRQEISLGDGCHSFGTAVHEVLHALGVHHEQGRPDRDSHVLILWDFIEESQKHNFNIMNIDSLGSPYQTKSIMHYNSFAFSITSGPPFPTILTKDGSFIDRNDEPTVEDHRQLNLYYGC